MQDTAAIAEAGNALTIQEMCVNTRHLRRHVGTHTEAASGKLIDKLEGGQLKQRTGAGQQGVEVLKQRRHDLFITMPLQQIKDRTAQALNGRRLMRQRIGNVFGK